MKPTLKKIIALAAAFIFCTAATVYLNRSDSQADQPQEASYYFANYESAESILAVQIDNSFGNVTLIHTNEEVYTYVGEEEATPSTEAINSLYNAIHRLPLQSYLSGASSSDPQYGLSEPAAEVYIQSTDGEAFMFYVGAPAPSGGAHYVCLAGDGRVFLMSDEYASLFLSDLSEYVLE